MNAAETFQIHYYLANDSHAMDASVRNRCEAELLGIFQEVCATLGVSIRVETVALQEGGLKEFWKAIGDNKDQINTVLTIFTALMALAAFISSRIPVSDTEKDIREKKIQELTIEEKQLAIEERRLALEKIRKEMKDGQPSKEAIDGAARAAEQSLKVQSRRSNFYKQLSNYEKVTAVGFAPLDEEDKPTDAEKIVPRSDFQHYVLVSNELPIETVEAATIEIVAPVLKEGNYKWKGIYQGEHISFWMTDAEFKNSVLRKEVSFQHGSVITCILQISRKFDELGEIVITGFSVETVLNKTDGGVTVETAQGKRHKATKKLVRVQQTLF